GIVGDVDVARIGPHLGDLAKNGEAAEPGIKDENGGSHGGCWYEKNGRRAMSSRSARSGVRRLPLSARAQNRRALRPFSRVKPSFTLAKNSRNLYNPFVPSRKQQTQPRPCIWGASRRGSKIRLASKPARGCDRTRPRSCRTPARRSCRRA